MAFHLGWNFGHILVLTTAGDWWYRCLMGHCQRCCYSAQDSPNNEELPSLGYQWCWGQETLTVWCCWRFLFQGKKVPNCLCLCPGVHHVWSILWIIPIFSNLITSPKSLKSFNGLTSHTVCSPDSFSMANRVTSPQTSTLISMSRWVGTACVMYLHPLSPPLLDDALLSWWSKSF